MNTKRANFGLFQRVRRLDLVQRLRAVFVLIVAVMGIAVGLALWQFNILTTAQGKLLRTSVPVLVQSQVVERALHELVLTLSQIEVAPSQEALVPIERQADEQLSRAQVSVTGLSRVLESTKQTDVILGQISDMEAGIQNNLATKRGLFDTEKTLEMLYANLIRHRSEIRKIAEDMSFQASLEMDQSFSDILALDDRGASPLSLILRSDIRTVSQIAQLSQELETIANVVVQISNKASQEQLRDTRDFLAFRLRGALKLMVRLPDTPARTELASKVAELRDKIFGPEGILHHTEEFIKHTQVLEEEHAKEKIVVREITTATERLMASAHAQLTRAGHSTQVSTQRLILILAIAAISVAIIVALTTLVIVERQINQRIALLTNSVLRIAAGDIEHETRVSGDDELGRMAVALDIFKRNARELLRSNSELEKFAYAAAHDLRTPLQAIHDLTTWTIEDEENQLSDDSTEYLNLLQDRIGRLSALLSDLLRYARIGAEIEELSEVDLDALVRDTKAFLDPANTFKITHVWDGSTLETYRHPLQKVLLNLMSNTLKHHGSQSGQIHISSRLSQGRLWVEYSDDGLGIPEEYHAKIFGLFQTLRPKDEMEGSGLGLAIAKKLVEQFDGSIRVQSNPENSSGVTFVFDFPAKILSETLARAA